MRTFLRCPKDGTNLRDGECPNCSWTPDSGIPPRVVEIPVVEMAVTTHELEQLRFAQIRQRNDWPAVFGCNRHRDVWLWVTYGYHRMEDRRPIVHPLVNQIVDVYLGIRPSGGRFFIDAEGAFYQEEGMPLLRFASFNLTKRSVRTRSPIDAPTRRDYSGAEALAKILGA